MMTVYELNRDLEIEFSYNIYRRSLVKTLKKLRRSWKYKDYVLMGNILTNMETYKKLDPQLRLTDKMQMEILVYPMSLLDEMNELEV